jgi:hypothetical protein
MNGVDTLRVLFAPLVTIQVSSPLDFSTPAAAQSVPSRKPRDAAGVEKS